MRITKFLEDSALFNLSLTYEHVMGGFQQQLEKEGVQFVEALVLTGIFFEQGPVRPTQLAKTFLSSKSNMSHVLRRLEKKGLLERSLLKEDARAYLFSLSKEGRRKAPRLIKIFDSTEHQIESSLAGKRINPVLKIFRISFGGTWCLASSGVKSGRRNPGPANSV